MIHLRSVSLKPSAKKQDGFPFNIAAVRKLREVEFRRPVTFFVGENGTGKSTLLEALAAGAGSVVVGGEDVRTTGRSRTRGGSRRS